MLNLLEIQREMVDSDDAKNTEKEVWVLPLTGVDPEFIKYKQRLYTLRRQGNQALSFLLVLCYDTF